MSRHYHRKPTTPLHRLISRLVREAAGCTGKPWPIEVEDGFAPPRLCGEGFYWTTPSGKTIVHHPNAYKWPTWYHQSTYHIKVGAGWVCQALAEAWDAQDAVRALWRASAAGWKKILAAAGDGASVHFTSEGGFSVRSN